MSSTRSQRSANALKAQCMHCERRKSTVKRCECTENRKQELRRNTIERHASSVAMPWSLLGHRDRPFFMKNIRDFSRSHGTSKNYTTPSQCRGNAAWCDRALSCTHKLMNVWIYAFLKILALFDFSSPWMIFMHFRKKFDIHVVQISAC